MISKKTLYIFNPEHDIALASNLEHFTAPHAGRQLRHDLGFLPALWASEKDVILVDDVDAAIEGMRRLGMKSTAKFIEYDMLPKLMHGVCSESLDVIPWGWDSAIRHYLKEGGMDVDSLPTNAWLNSIRIMSNRSWAAQHILKPLRKIDGTIGESSELRNIDEVKKYLSAKHNVVLKAPWSSSGRGIRYLSDIEGAWNIDTPYYGITYQLEGWIKNVILRQGSIMAEPYYNKVCDLGMEYFSDGLGNITYCGLSFFNTANGAYTGNVLDEERHKEDMLCRLMPKHLLEAVKNHIILLLSEDFSHTYRGPFGIDMMLVRKDDSIYIHPCVELNLRMTMGHVSLLLADKYKLEDKVMRITYSGGTYRLRIE